MRFFLVISLLLCLGLSGESQFSNSLNQTECFVEEISDYVQVFTIRCVFSTDSMLNLTDAEVDVTINERTKRVATAGSDYAYIQFNWNIVTKDFDSMEDDEIYTTLGGELAITLELVGSYENVTRTLQIEGIYWMLEDDSKFDENMTFAGLAFSYDYSLINITLHCDANFTYVLGIEIFYMENGLEIGTLLGVRSSWTDTKMLMGFFTEITLSMLDDYVTGIRVTNDADVSVSIPSTLPHAGSTVSRTSTKAIGGLLAYAKDDHLYVAVVTYSVLSPLISYIKRDGWKAVDSDMVSVELQFTSPLALSSLIDRSGNFDPVNVTGEAFQAGQKLWYEFTTKRSGNPGRWTNIGVAAQLDQFIQDDRGNTRTPTGFPNPNVKTAGWKKKSSQRRDVQAAGSLETQTEDVDLTQLSSGSSVNYPTLIGLDNDGVPYVNGAQRGVFYVIDSTSRITRVFVIYIVQTGEIIGLRFTVLPISGESFEKTVGNTTAGNQQVDTVELSFGDGDAEDNKFFVGFTITYEAGTNNVLSLSGVRFDFFPPLEIAIDIVDGDLARVKWYSTYDYANLTAKYWKTSNPVKVYMAMCNLGIVQGEMQECIIYDLDAGTEYNLTLIAMYEDGDGPAFEYASNSLLFETESGISLECESDADNNVFNQRVEYEAVPQPLVTDMMVESMFGGMNEETMDSMVKKYAGEGYFQLEDPPLHFYGYPINITVRFNDTNASTPIFYFSVAMMIDEDMNMQNFVLVDNGQMENMTEVSFDLTDLRIVNVRGTYNADNLLTNFGLDVVYQNRTQFTLPAANRCSSPFFDLCNIIVAQPSVAVDEAPFYIESFQLKVNSDKFITGLKARYVSLDMPQFLLNDRNSDMCMADLTFKPGYVRNSYYTKYLRYGNCGMNQIVFNDADAVDITSDANYIMYSQSWMRKVDYGLEEQISKANQLTITRSNSFQISFNCKVDDDGRVTSSFSTKEEEAQMATGYNRLTFEIKFFQDSEYADSFSSTPTYAVGSSVYYTVSMDSETQAVAGFRLTARDCWASSESNPDSDNYYKLEEDTCPADDTWSRNMQYSTDFVEYMKFTAFQWVGDDAGRPVYLHCQVYVCNSTSTGTSCNLNQNCASRRRRALGSFEEEGRDYVQKDVVSYKSHILFLNPEKMRDLFKEDSSGHYFGTSNSLMTIFFVCMVVLTAVMTYKLVKLHKHGAYVPLQETA